MLSAVQLRDQQPRLFEYVYKQGEGLLNLFYILHDQLCKDWRALFGKGRKRFSNETWSMSRITHLIHIVIAILIYPHHYDLKCHQCCHYRCRCRYVQQLSEYIQRRHRHCNRTACMVNVMGTRWDSWSSYHHLTSAVWNGDGIKIGPMYAEGEKDLRRYE